MNRRIIHNTKDCALAVAVVLAITTLSILTGRTMQGESPPPAVSTPTQVTPESLKTRSDIILWDAQQLNNEISDLNVEPLEDSSAVDVWGFVLENDIEIVSGWTNVYTNGLILERIGYTVAYAERMGAPVAVWYELTDSPAHHTKRPAMRFKTDLQTASRIKHGDYTRTGWDRGHMAPSHAIGAEYGREAQIETFLMSNVVRQNPAVNRNVWRKLESKVLTHYAKERGRVLVITGPMFSTADIGRPRGLKTPSAFWKVIVWGLGRDPHAAAYFILNNGQFGKRDPEDFRINIDFIEGMIGFDLLRGMINEDAVEAELSL